MNAVATVEPIGDGIMAVIARAATDPNVDIDKMERLLQMQKCPDEWAEMAKHKKRDAQEELDAWLAEIERPCPTCGEPDPTEAVMADCSLCTPTFDLPRGYFGDGTTPERHLDTTREE